MKFNLDTAEIYVQDDFPKEEALARTTHLCIAAHQDDIEIMAPQPIIDCYQRADKWFSGVVVTDGRSSPRNGIYEKFSDEEMRMVRNKEQRKAAAIGEFAAQVFLDYPSSAVKEAGNIGCINDIVAVLRATRPEFVYTHNLADKHATHIGVAVKVIESIRRLPSEEQPRYLYGCEVWRGLDWLIDEEKVLMDCSAHGNLQASLLGVFDSQISGGKRYDLASMGRRAANATFFTSHEIDHATRLAFAMDLTPLIKNPDFLIPEYVQAHIDKFAQEVNNMITSVL